MSRQTTGVSARNMTIVFTSMLFLTAGCSEIQLGAHLLKQGKKAIFGTATEEAPTVLSYTPPAMINGQQRGIAAWDGNDQAVGMTASHPTLPVNSWVRVTNSSTGQSAVVEITSNSNEASGRAIDVSKSVADVLGFLDDGQAMVMVEPTTAPTSSPTITPTEVLDDSNFTSIVAASIESSELPALVPAAATNNTTYQLSSEDIVVTQEAQPVIYKGIYGTTAPASVEQINSSIAPVVGEEIVTSEAVYAANNTHVGCSNGHNDVTAYQLPNNVQAAQPVVTSTYRCINGSAPDANGSCGTGGSTFVQPTQTNVTSQVVSTSANTGSYATTYGTAATPAVQTYDAGNYQVYEASQAYETTQTYDSGQSYEISETYNSQPVQYESESTVYGITYDTPSSNIGQAVNETFVTETVAQSDVYVSSGSNAVTVQDNLFQSEVILGDGTTVVESTEIITASAEHSLTPGQATTEYILASNSGNASQEVIQVATFGVPANAERLISKLQGKGLNAFAVPVEYSGKQLYRVRVGSLQNAGGAQQALQYVQSMGHGDAKIVRK